MYHFLEKIIEKCVINLIIGQNHTRRYHLLDHRNHHRQQRVQPEHRESHHLERVLHDLLDRHIDRNKNKDIV